MFNKEELQMIEYALGDKLALRRGFLGGEGYQEAVAMPGNSVYRYYQLYIKIRDLLENGADK